MVSLFTGTSELHRWGDCRGAAVKMSRLGFSRLPRLISATSKIVGSRYILSLFLYLHSVDSNDAVSLFRGHTESRLCSEKCWPISVQQVLAKERRPYFSFLDYDRILTGVLLIIVEFSILHDCTEYTLVFFFFFPVIVPFSSTFHHTCACTYDVYPNVVSVYLHTGLESLYLIFSSYCVLRTSRSV